MVTHQVLFCPFCRESFEGAMLCPEHELRLVRFDQLSSVRGVDDEDDDDERPVEPIDRPLAPLDPRYGRAPVAVGAVLGVACLGTDIARLPGGQAAMPLGVALVTAPSLGTLPLASFTLLWIVLRRRTRRALSGVRLLVTALGFVELAAAVHAFMRLRRLYPAEGGELALLPGTVFGGGVALAAALVVWGGLRLGR